jgi:hypothetical protein
MLLLSIGYDILIAEHVVSLCLPSLKSLRTLGGPCSSSPWPRMSQKRRLVLSAVLQFIPYEVDLPVTTTMRVNSKKNDLGLEWKTVTSQHVKEYTLSDSLLRSLIAKDVYAYVSVTMIYICRYQSARCNHESRSTKQLRIKIRSIMHLYQRPSNRQSGQTRI